MNDADLLCEVLAPYRENCRYLRTAEVRGPSRDEIGGRGKGSLSASFEFWIPESCYIEDTGHFNSVEFNICYNQMVYYVLAKAVVDRLVEPFSRWTLREYRERQLSGFLITDFRSTFRRAMSGRCFSGEVEVVDIVEWGGERREPMTILNTKCQFWDESGGNCHGEVKVVVTGGPDRPEARAGVASP